MNSTKRYVSVICEYNPFHFGHKFQLDILKQNFDGVICIISGDIVQRGSVAVADKYLRAEAALRAGASLVLELPLPWCCSSAADFAAAGVFIANAIESDSLAFGAEDGLELIESINAFVSRPETQRLIKTLVGESGNLSYPAALTKTVKDALGDKAGEAVTRPNNILALEYLKALDGSKAKPFAVKRSPDFKSSSEIRKCGGGSAVISELPEESGRVFKTALGARFPRDPKRLDAYFIGSLRRLSRDNIIPENLYSVTDDLYKKIIAEAMRCSDTESLVLSCCNKIYTAARVRRAINSIVFKIDTARVKAFPPYTTVLAADETGCEILKGLKKNAQIEIITKPAHVKLASEATKEAFLFAKGIEDIISLSSPLPPRADEAITPTILKSEK